MAALKYWNGTAWVDLKGDPGTAGANGATNLTTTRTATDVTIVSDTGADATVPAADTSVAGMMTAADRTKLTGVATGADVTATALPSALSSATAKTTPVDADTMPLNDSAAGNAVRKLSWANLRGALRASFDTVYAAVTHQHSGADITSGVIAPARHGTGTADATTILYGDGAFRTAPPGTRVPYATTSYTSDDFIGGTNGSGNIGQIGWNTAGGNVNTPASEPNHPGILGRNSGSVANTYAWTRLIFGCMASDLFDLIYLFRLDAGSAGTDTLVRLGLGTTGSANPDTDGLYLEKLAADVNWFYVARVGGVQTRTDSGVAVVAGAWLKLQIRRISGGIGFRVGAGAEVVMTTNVPTTSLLPFFAVLGTTTTARGLGVDFFDLQVAVTR